MPPAAIRYSISEHELCGLAVNIHSFKHILRNTEFIVIIDHSALLYILNAKREPPTLRLKKLIEVLSQYYFKVKFLGGKDMTISDFLSRHPGQGFASPNEIIPISFQSKELLNDTDICCPVKKVPTLVERVTIRKAQPGEVAPIWPLTCEPEGQNIYLNNSNTSNQLRDKYNLTNLWCKQKYMFQWNTRPRGSNCCLNDQ